MSKVQHIVRVRFAPSPTGHLHIGGLRTALFNLLFAHHHGGQFLLRIEDTDRQRSQQVFTDAILEALQWTDIQPDEPPVIQSTRMERHRELIDQLVDIGKAYRCYCTVGLGASKETYLKYDGKCRAGMYDGDVAGKPYVVRIKIPLERESITFTDLIRGPITIAMDQLDDFIIARSDGSPVYNFVVVVDDHQMGITHVIRGEDHISNTPKQLLLYEAFDWQPPAFAHLPLILGPSGGRLSKRDAATSVLDYRTNGYLPEALCNYLVRLGWAHGDQEIFTRDELIKLFTLKDVGKSGAVFDQEKLEWINGMYIRDTDAAQLLAYIKKYVAPDIQKKLSWDTPKLIAAIVLYKERATTLTQLIDQLILLHDGPQKVSQEDSDTWITDQTPLVLSAVVKELVGLGDWHAATIKEVIKKLCVARTLKLSQVAQPIRLALLGTTHSPGVFDVMALLGKEETNARLQKFIATSEHAT